MSKNKKNKTEVVNAVVVQENLPATQITTLTLLDKAMSGGADMAQLEKFMDLHERYEKTEARKAYVVAMSAFKANPPKIYKEMAVKYKNKAGTETDYKHADLADAAFLINEGLSQHGLSSAWKQEQPKDNVKITCVITHVMGHSESTSLEAEPDASGGKNSIQAIGSTNSYLERYTLFALVGIAAHNMDDDGKGSEPTPTINDDQENQLESLINENINKPEEYTPRFLEFLKVNEFNEIPAAKFQYALKTINDVIKAASK